MRRRDRGSRQPDGAATLGGGLVGIGGWLFADLLLALSVIFLVSIGSFAMPRPTHIDPTPTVSATPPSTICTKSISPTPRMARYDPSPSHARPTDQQLVQAFAAPPREEAGLVQTKVTDADIGTAYQDAQWVNAELRKEGLLPGAITANTYFDDLGWQDRFGDRWLVEFTIYPYVVSCKPQ